VATPDRLPRGRHRLSRAEVADSQRSRLLRAMAEAVAEQGYANTSVATVLRRAHVSRESFYEQFANKEQCFLAAYDASAGIVLRGMGDALDPAEPAGDAVDRLGRALRNYLAMLQSEPAIARTFLVEVYAAGEAALARRVAVQQRFVDVVAELAGAQSAEQRFACEAVVAAVAGLVTQRVCAGRLDDLDALHEPLMRHAREVLAANGLLT
jgi:AcrR family transcriptional regulator